MAHGLDAIGTLLAILASTSPASSVAGPALMMASEVIDREIYPGHGFSG